MQPVHAGDKVVLNELAARKVGLHVVGHKPCNTNQGSNGHGIDQQDFFADFLVVKELKHGSSFIDSTIDLTVYSRRLARCQIGVFLVRAQDGTQDKKLHRKTSRQKFQ